MRARIGIGVVGAGRMGSIHARLIAHQVPEARLAGIADVNLDAARRVAGQTGDPPVFASVDELLEARGVDAILVATSSSTHLAAIEAAAGAGKDILCEKPIALTLADTDRAIAVTERAGVRLQVGFMRRWDPDYRRAKARLASGELGVPMLFKSLQFDAEPPPPSFADPTVSGGIMVDMGIHEFDLARWLMDDEVAEVHAFGSSLAHPELGAVGDVDSAVVDIRFRGGSTGSVELARNTTYGEDVRTEVLATAGSLWITDLPTGRGAWSGGAVHAAVARDAADPALPRFEAGYAAQTRAFVQALADDRPVAVTGHDGRAALAVALACDRSVREGLAITLD